MKAWAALLLCSVLGACADLPQPPQQRADFYFDDAAFAPSTERVDAADVFAVTDEMRHYVQHEIDGQLRARGPQRGLVVALYNREQLRLEYDSATTRNAREAFAARSGNCLSLVIMTAALAKQIGVPVHYQNVIVDEAWSRHGDLYFSSGHVNLVLGHRVRDFGRGGDASEDWTIDFLPGEDLRGQRTRALAESTIVAMFMNNRAAESLVDGKLDNAYWWAREALVQDPTFYVAYNTLGVIYLRHGNLPQAAAVLTKALEQQPRDTRVIANLAQVMHRLGNEAEATRLRQRLAQIEPQPPFHYFNLGRAAMEAGNYAAARDYFARELAREPDYHEFHFWIAQADFKLGNLEDARKHLATAQQNSPTRSSRDIYAAKLAWIRGLRDHGPQ